MKDNGRKTIAMIAFLAISLAVINVIIFSADFSGGMTTRFVKSIIKNNENYNTSVTLQPTEGIHEEDKEAKSKQNDLTNDSRKQKQEKGDEVSSSATPAARQQASGKVLIEQSTRRVLADEGMNERCFPASTTKVLTALVVLKRLPLDMIVTVPKEAAGIEGSSIYLRAEQKISVEDLLFGMMLRSGNDAACALAIATAGSVDKFADMMNETARSIGACNSHFVNPHGLHDDEHYTTAFDLALITAAAFEFDDFRRIVSSKIAKISTDGESVAIGNKNKLLSIFDGANGVKTGYTKTSGRCLVGAAEREGMQLISVVLNCPDMWNDSMRLLNFGFDNYKMTPLELALALPNDGKVPVEVPFAQAVSEDWRDIYYPLMQNEYPVLMQKRA